MIVIGSLRCRASQLLASLLVMTVLMSHISCATAADDAFKGRNLSVIVGFSAGGAYDLYARVLGRHMGRNLPGGPALVVQNMPGAGGIKAASYLYEIAPKDGTSFGTFARGVVIAPLFGEGTFDSTKFNWIGSVTDDVNVCLSWHTSPVKTWNDLLTKPFTVAGQGPQADPNIYANLMKNLFGAPIKIVTGYPGTTEIGLAMERGEVDGVCAISYSTVKTTFGDKIKNKQLNIIFQAGPKASPDLPGVPLLFDQAHDARQRDILKLVMGVQGMARPFAAPPGIPDDRRDYLRDAFAKTMQDPEFLSEAKKLNLEVNPKQGADVKALVDEIFRTPKDVIEQARQAIVQR